MGSIGVSVRARAVASMRASEICSHRLSDFVRDGLRRNRDTRVKTIMTRRRSNGLPVESAGAVRGGSTMMNAKRTGGHAAAGMVIAVSLLLAPSVFAGEATLFADRNYQGPAMTVRGPSPNLERIGFNDTASSMVVRAGVWEVCSKPYFEGHCAQLQPGEYSSFGTDINDRIASVREVTQTIGGAPAPSTAPAASAPRIVLYEHAGFGGRSITLTGSVPNLDR